MLYVYDLAWIVNERDQPILVPAYIKHRQIAHKVGGTEGRLQRAGVLPHRSLDRVCPVLERLGRFREPRAEFPNPPLADDPHTPSSHIWNQRVKWAGLGSRLPISRTSNSKPPFTPCSDLNSRIRRLLTTLTPQVPIYGTNGSSGLGWVPACRSRAPATRSRLLHLAQGQGKTARAHFDAHRPPRRRIDRKST